MAYDRLYPLNQTDRLLAYLTTRFFNVHRDPKTRALRLEDFLPNPFVRRLSPDEEQRAVADAKAILNRGYMERKRARADA